MARTTIARDLIKLIQLGAADKEEVLRHLAAASTGAERLRRGSPAVTVKFHTLRKLARAEGAEPEALAQGTSHDRELIDTPIYDVTSEAPLFALTDSARVDVLRFGRDPDQDVHFDDMRVSREHGLVIFADRFPLYCDYGSLIDGKHAGSRNGTYLDGVTRISDAMIAWLPGQALLLGRRYRDPANQLHHSIKITYELHGPGHDDGYGN